MEQLKAMKEQLMGVVQGQLGNLQNVNAEELGAAVDMIKDLADAMKLCEEEKYYKAVTKAMEDREKEEKNRPQHHHYYNTEYVMPMMYPEYPDPMGDYYRDMDRNMGKMYYGSGSNGGSSSGSNGGNGSSMGGNSGGSNNGMHGYRGRAANGQFTSRSGRGGEAGRRGYSDDELMYMDGGQYPMEMRDHREGSSPIRRKYYMESKELHQDKKTQMEELEKYMGELSKDITEMIQDASPEETTLLKQKLATLIEKIK